MADPLTALIVGTAALILVTRRRRRHRRRPVILAAPMAAIADTIAAPSRVEELLIQFVRESPLPGHFYQVQWNDTLEQIAQQALDTVGRNTKAQRLDYIHCISSGPVWNLYLYGTPSTTKTFGAELLVPGINKGMRVAFMPRNDDALALMLAGIRPARTVGDKKGQPITSATSYGLLWLPPVDPVELARGEVSCAPYEWDDGSSTLDPPPHLIGLLEAA